ncbi:MAG: DMT family transporter [Flavobacteriaceae bacterium]|nr:DMT family transporter [Flavobacteriaceae bacterium]
MNSKSVALIAAFLVAIIYGINYTIAKEVMPTYIKPYGFILLRVLGAAILFWLLSLFTTKQKIDKSDFGRIILAALFGVCINMLAFFKGLSLTSPINASVIMVNTPILVLILSAIILKEKITFIKVLGILIGLAGAILLIVYGKSTIQGDHPLIGNSLIFVNATSYGLYLIIVKKLTQKYNAITLIKWLYLFGLLMVIPFGISELQEVSWQEIPDGIYFNISYVIIFTTFFAYLLNLFALTRLRPTTLSAFIYLQPLLASSYALLLKKDSLNSLKVIAAILIFSGVYLVTKSNNPKKASELGSESAD